MVLKVAFDKTPTAVHFHDWRSPREREEGQPPFKLVTIYYGLSLSIHISLIYKPESVHHDTAVEFLRARDPLDHRGQVLSYGRRTLRAGLQPLGAEAR